MAIMRPPAPRSFASDGFVATVVGGEAQTTVVVSGELDLHSTSWFTAALEHAREAATDGLVVDLGRLTFLDSTGIAALATASRDAVSQGHEFSVRGACAQPRRVLEITGLLGRLEHGGPRHPAAQIFHEEI